jgi:hypothetical protein
MKYWKLSKEEIMNAPAVVLDKLKHNEITRELQSKLRTRMEHSKETYQEVYEKYPEYLSAMKRYFQ